MYRTAPVPNRVNPRNRKFSDPPSPLQNASFSADHRSRPSCILRLKIGPADASRCLLHSPRQRNARDDHLSHATCTHSGPKQRFWPKSEGIIGKKGSSMVESRSPDVPSHLAARPDPKKPDPATQQLSRWRCTLWLCARAIYKRALELLELWRRAWRRLGSGSFPGRGSVNAPQL